MSPNILVICPLKPELLAIAERWVQLGYQKIESNSGRLKVFQFLDLNISLAVGGHGKAQFAIQTQYLIQTLPKLTAVICAGSAGALSAQLKAGDVVVGETTVEHDFQLKFMKRPDPEFTADANLLSQLKAQKSNGFQIYFGKIASGDEDIVDRARASELHRQTGAIAVAWEGAGGARACKFNSLPFVEVRGITDHSDSDVMSAFEVNLKSAMYNVADFLADTLAIVKK